VLVRLLLLHGFTATGRSWDPVRRALPPRYDVVAPDLRPAPFAETVAALRQTGPYALGGYSMGGRIALHLALAQPDRVRALVLVSTTAGLADAGERAARRAADEELAASVVRDGVEAFAARWAAGPLFAGQPAEVAAAAHADRLRWSAADLAAALRLQGTGVMEPVWDRLGELTMPVRVVAGERDEKFRALGERLVAALPAATLTVVPGAGHAVHLEAPEAVAAAISEATTSGS